MKRKIGEIYNKPIIEGDINLKTPNKIHKSELSGGGGSDSGGEVKEWYYLVNSEKLIQDMNITDSSAAMGFMTIFIPYFASYYIVNAGYDDNDVKNEVGFTDITSNAYFYLSRLNAIRITDSLPMIFPDKKKRVTKYVYGDLYQRQQFMGNLIDEDVVNTAKSYFVEISKKEYYDLIAFTSEEINK